MRPQPIVDTIAEHEKYGNTGDQFRSIGNVIIEKYENFSNFLNSAVDVSFYQTFTDLINGFYLSNDATT